MEEIKANIFVAKKKLKLREGFFFLKKNLSMEAMITGH
jgi:hypothetical protein